MIPSEDREIRGAKVRIVNRKGTLTRLRRLIQSLLPIEVNCKEQGKNIHSLLVDEENDKEKTVEKPDRPPRRLAAENADLYRKLTVVDQSHPD